MGVLAIHLRDSGIMAARADGQLLAIDSGRVSSPGFVWFGKDDVVTGVEAVAQVFRHPMDVSTRIWEQLDTSPANPRKSGQAGRLNRAEAACAHLRRLLGGVVRGEDRVVMGVPSFYDQTQLGILLSIANELEVPLEGIVSSVVAAAVAVGSESGAHDADTMLIVEVGLHRSLLAIVERGAGGEFRLASVRVSPDVGLHAFHLRWLGAVADEFVRTTRFDPRHGADSEQMLYGTLLDLLERCAADPDADRQLALQTEHGVHRVTATDQLLAQAGQDLVSVLSSEVRGMASSGRVSRVVLSDDVLGAPGLLRGMRSQVSIPVSVLSHGAVVSGLAGMWPDRFDQSESPRVAYHTRVVAAGEG